MIHGVVAHLGERLHGMQEVKGSIPFSSTSIQEAKALYHGRLRLLQLASRGIMFERVAVILIDRLA